MGVEASKPSKLFMDHLAPSLFKANEATEALYLQLKDNHAKILNEGAARGLTATFAAAIDRLNLPSWNGYQGPSEPKTGDGYVFTDINYVIGLLRWLVQEKRDTYFTRSSVVARAAACLKEVGYFIGQIQVWDGSGDSPRRQGSNAIVLVIGGSSETDPLVSPYDAGMGEFVYHYHFNTAGAMFSNALRNQSDIPPEAFQTFFEQTYSYIESHLNLRWNVTTAEDYDRYYGPYGSSRIHNRGIRSIRAKAEWTRQGIKSSSISTRLASLHFSLSAELIAPCYERLSNPESLRLILDKKYAYIAVQDQEVPRDLVIFRVITASIAISIAARLAENNFKVTQHSICLDLVGGSWLETICSLLDESFSARLSLNDAVFVLAAVHAGCSDALAEHQDVKDELVGWRNGVYAIVPSVILEMGVIPQAIGLRCYEGFWANAIVRKTGAIVSGPNRMLYLDNSIVHRTEADTSSLQSLADPFISPPVRGPPDVPLYLNIERSTHADEPEMCFCGRIGGRSVGTVGIKEVMTTLVQSFEEQEECLGHQDHISVVNVKASKWASKDLYKPVGQWDKHHTFVPVQNDPCWALFLAGQSSYFDGRVVRGCVDCAAQKMLDASVLIGYS
jgi:hypothetical protein